jgi:hypothetical protein
MAQPTHANTPRTLSAATRLPASADAWQLYEGAPVTVVRELNAALRAAAMDSGLKEAVKKAKKAARDSYGDFSRHRLERSEAWKELLTAQYAAFRTHVQPVLNKHSEFGTTDSEPYHVASGWLSRTILDALGVTEPFDRTFLLRAATEQVPMNRTLVANVVARHLAATYLRRQLATCNVGPAPRTAAASVKLDNSTRQKINMALMRSGMDGNKPWPRLGQALNEIGEVLANNGISHDIMSADRFRGRDGITRLDIDFINEADPFSPTPITNSMLVITYHQFEETDRWEIIAYLS